MHQPIEIKGIERVNEFVDPELLKTTDVAVLRNMILDKSGGKAIKRGGLSLFNSNSAGAGINSLHDVVDSSGNNVLLASSATKLIKSALGTGAWSDLKTGLTTGLKTKIVPYLDKFVITNGTDAPFVTDLTTTWSLEITAPVVTSIVTSESTGGNLNVGSYPYYRYMLVYVSDLGEMSNPSQPFSHLFTDTTTSGRKIRLDNLPISSDSRVVSRLLFRTKNISNTNTGGTYYLLATLDNITTNFIDSYADTLLDLSKTITLVTVPTKAKSILAHKERIFLGNVTLSDKLQISPEVSKVDSSPEAGYTAGVELTLTGATEPGEGQLTAGTYKYRFALTTADGKISDYIERTITLTAGQNEVLISNPPTSPSTGMTLSIYRTKVNGSVFYKLLRTVGYFMTIFIDFYADSSLTSVMPSSTTVTHKSGVLYSEIGQPSSINAYNIKQINPDDGDEITKLIDIGDRVIIFKKNSICQMLTLGDPLNWQIEVIYNKKGGDEEHLIQKAGDRIYFISNKQLYRFPDQMEKPISLNKINSFKNITTFKDCFYSNYYNWFFVIADTSLYVYDEKLDCWYDFVSEDGSYETWTCGVEKLHGTTRDTLIFGHSGQYTVTKYDPSVFLDGGEEIVSTITFKTLTLNNSNYLVRLRKLSANYKKRDNQTVTHYFGDTDAGTYKVINDTTNATYSSDYKSYKTPTDSMTGDLTLTGKFYYKIYGAGLDEFNGAVIRYGLRNRGTRG
jgi:hypothetical protein